MHAGFAKIDWRLSGPASCEQRTRSSEQFQVVAVCVPAPSRAVLSWCSGYAGSAGMAFPGPGCGRTAPYTHTVCSLSVLKLDISAQPHSGFAIIKSRVWREGCQF